MIRGLQAGSLYFLIVFGAGFALGTIRVLILVPYVGPLVATLIEVPVMLSIAYYACRMVFKRWPVSAKSKQRLAMVLIFLALLIIFEWQLGMLLFRQSAEQQWLMLTTPAGMIGLTAQMIAALFPLFIDHSKQK